MAKADPGVFVDSRSTAGGELMQQARRSGSVVSLERRGAELELRKRPTQARGALTFQTIMDTTLQLLDEVGVEALTTNLVAEVAGINIATLYQYFPSKESILLELFRRDTDARMAGAREVFKHLNGVANWRDLFCATIDHLVAHRVSRPGVAALRRAMQSLPALRDYERETMLRSANFIAERILVPHGLDDARASQVAFCVMEALTSLLDVAAFGYGRALGEEDDDWIVEELKTMLIRYLSPYLDN